MEHLDDSDGLEAVAGGGCIEPGWDGGGSAALSRANQQRPGAQQLNVATHDAHQSHREGDQAQIQPLIHWLVQLHTLCTALHATQQGHHAMRRMWGQEVEAIQDTMPYVSATRFC